MDVQFVGAPAEYEVASRFSHKFSFPRAISLFQDFVVRSGHCVRWIFFDPLGFVRRRGWIGAQVLRWVLRRRVLSRPQCFVGTLAAAVTCQGVVRIPNRFALFHNGWRNKGRRLLSRRRRPKRFDGIAQNGRTGCIHQWSGWLSLRSLLPGFQCHRHLLRPQGQHGPRHHAVSFPCVLVVVIRNAWGKRHARSRTDRRDVALVRAFGGIASPDVALDVQNPLQVVPGQRIVRSTVSGNRSRVQRTVAGGGRRRRRRRRESGHRVWWGRQSRWRTRTSLIAWRLVQRKLSHGRHPGAIRSGGLRFVAFVVVVSHSVVGNRAIGFVRAGKIRFANTRINFVCDSFIVVIGR
mmetsp:Transcript_27994/g.76048  ORF Transcript_27994/g.76048 Transcript_27994/m.76048 type:complete len:349 (+) Transcript_27994:1418-2464(+)